MDKKIRQVERVSRMVVIKSETKNTTAFNDNCICCSCRNCLHYKLLYLPTVFLRVMPHDEEILQYMGVRQA
jgi:hypothetical protein